MYKDEGGAGRRMGRILVDDRELISKDYTREKVYPIPVHSARRETEDRIYPTRNLYGYVARYLKKSLFNYLL